MFPDKEIPTRNACQHVRNDGLTLPTFVRPLDELKKITMIFKNCNVGVSQDRFFMVFVYMPIHNSLASLTMEAI